LDFIIKFRRTSTYELSRNEEFVFTNIAGTNKLRPLIHLTNTEPRAYEHFNKFNDISYEKNKFTIRIFKLQTHYVHKLGFACTAFTSFYIRKTSYIGLVSFCFYD
jgi:hypothetical protein